eukprot:scaffold22620_cov131-Cylindrotheca_fusiformis.AAC.2
MVVESLSVATTSNNNNNKKKSNPAGTKKIASEREYPNIENEHLLTYKSGIPTLRSSAHRVKFDKKNRKHDPKPKDRNGIETHTTWLPKEVRKEDIFSYKEEDYDLKGAVMELLQNCDKDIVGDFESKNNNAMMTLEDFRVPVPATWRKVNGGQCEDSQKYLSDQVATNEQFLKVFDKFVVEVALPYAKERLQKACCSCQPTTTTTTMEDQQQQQHKEEQPITFYYQRPPTLRLQPGPGWAKVKPHNDAEYGHQNGELNFWIPLTDRTLTGVDLWSESTFEQDDYHPIPANLGQVISFHGSSCRHYVNANASNHTRVSLDFRVGVEGYFDPYWQMKGTTDDHGRREATL